MNVLPRRRRRPTWASGPNTWTAGPQFAADLKGVDVASLFDSAGGGVTQPMACPPAHPCRAR